VEEKEGRNKQGNRWRMKAEGGRKYVEKSVAQ
jgi:hypothetical protein